MNCVLLVSKSETVRTFRQCLIRHLLERGDRVTVVAYDEQYRQETEALGATFYCVPQENRWLNPFAILRYTGQVYRILKREKPELVMTFQLKPNTFGVLAAAAPGVGQIVPMIEGAGDVFIHNTLKWKLIRLVSCGLYKAALGYAQRVFFLNREDKEEFIRRRLVKEEKCRVIPGIGVDLRQFSGQPVEHCRSFLMIARMLKTKGVEEYCRCARLVRQTYPDAVFRYLGAEGTVTLGDIRSYVDDGSVQYLGTTRDVRPYLRDCTCLVLPSYREGMPMAVMEAAAMGRCAIVTDAVGCRDAVIPGETGFTVPVGDCKALADKCIYLIEHPEAAVSMGAAARQLAEEKFDEEKINSCLLGQLEGKEGVACGQGKSRIACQ